MPDYTYKYQQGGVTRGGPEILVDIASQGWFGRVAVNSATGGAFYPVTTARVNSDSMFRFGLVGAPQTIAVAPVFMVTSIVPGTGFVVRCCASTAVASLVVSWELINPR